MTAAPTPSMVYDVIEACAEPGCPLCRVSRRWGGRFMAAILYEEVTDPHTRGRLKQSFGFCREHAWQAADVGGTLLGISIIYRGLLNQVDAALDRATPGEQKSWWSRLGAGSGEAAPPAGLTPPDPCPTCIYLDQMEETALKALLDAIPTNERLRTGLDKPDGGLCLPHLRRALALGQEPAAFRFLQASTRRKLAGLGAELDEFIRKYDHRFRKEEWGPERDSWQRAIAWVSGDMREPGSARTSGE